LRYQDCVGRLATFVNGVTSRLRQEVLRVAFYGSCQLKAASDMLSAALTAAGVAHAFEVVLNWEYIVSGRELPSSMYDADVLVYQVYNPEGRHADYHTDAIAERFGGVKPRIVVPFLNFGVYWPDMTRDERNEATKTAAAPYGAFPQQSSALRTREPKVLEEFDPTGAAWFAKMAQLEEGCDVRVTAFLRENFQARRLFYSAQHPCNEVLALMASQMLEKLHVNASVPQMHEMLHDHDALILDCVQDRMGPSWVRVTEYKVYCSPTLVDAAEYARLYREHLQK
jgi:hypothetical protein